MEIFKQIAPLKAYLSDVRRRGISVGLVPTMGALHEGHLHLIRTSKAETGITVCSIYVNPTQFNNAMDLQKYPRTLHRDTELLKEVHCDALFCPADEEMYPIQSEIKINFGSLESVMEGKFRPGHFSGVGLVVSKLFNIVEPECAYFGQKDWQQVAIISQLVEEFKFNLTVRSIPTLREHDGLAMSSRNQRLSNDQRKVATVFFQALTEARHQIQSGKSIAQVKTKVNEIVHQIPGVRLEYFEVADRKNLNLLENVSAQNDAIMCIAGYVGDVRLIDNMFVN